MTTVRPNRRPRPAANLPPHFLTCQCGIKLQRGYRVHYHHSVHTPGFHGFECIICLAAYDAEGNPNGKADGIIRA